MRLNQALAEKMMDVRLRDKLLAEGKLSKNQMNDAYKSMPDESNNVKYVQLDENKKNVEDPSANPQ